MNMKFHMLVCWYQYRCFNILLFNQFPSLLTFLRPNKNLYISGQFNDRCHNHSKVFYKTSVNNAIPLNTWICWRFLGGGMFRIACIFFGFSSFPSLEIIKPNIIPENIINAHLHGFQLIPYSLHFWKHSLNFCKWLSMSLYTIKSSRNIFIKLSKYFMNVLVTAFWYVGGPFLFLIGITFHIKAPQSITNVVLYLIYEAIDIWWYHEYPSKKKYASYPAIVVNISFVKGNGYGSLFVVTFNFLKFI